MERVSAWRVIESVDVDSIDMLIEDADMISYSANGAIQSAQKDLITIPFIQQVLLCAPYGRLGFSAVKENRPVDSSVLVDEDSSLLGKDLGNSEDLSGFAADVSSLFMGADSNDLDSILREVDSADKDVASNPESDPVTESNPAIETNAERQETLQRMIDRRSRVLQVAKEAIPIDVPTQSSAVLYTQPESVRMDSVPQNQKSPYFDSLPVDSQNGAIQMTQPSAVLLRERVKKHVQTEKRDALASGLASMGIEVVFQFLFYVGVFLEATVDKPLEMYCLFLHSLIGVIEEEMLLNRGQSVRTVPTPVSDCNSNGSFDFPSLIGSLICVSYYVHCLLAIALVTGFVTSDKSIVDSSCTMDSNTALSSQFLHNYTVNFDLFDTADTCACTNGDNPYIPNPTYATSVQRYDPFIRHREDTYMWMVEVVVRKWLEW